MDKKQSKENTNSIKPTFGQFMTQCRIKKGLTQKQFAEMLYVSESAVSKWENDKRRPDLDLVARISEIFEITESELIRACVDTTRIREKKQASKYKLIANIYNLTLFISFGLALLTCFIVAAATGGWNWFVIVVLSLLCAGILLLVPQYIRKHKLLIAPLIWLGSLYLLLGICNLITGGHAWFVIAFFAIALAYSLIFTPLLIKTYAPEKIRNNNVLISIAINACALFLMLLAIDIYSAIISTTLFGWCFTIALPILLYWLVPIYLTVIFIKHLKIHWGFKISCIVSIWLGFSQLFYVFLLILNIDVNTIYFWQANLFKWATGENISANVMLLVDCVSVLTALGFAIFGAIKTKIKRNNKA